MRKIRFNGGRTQREAGGWVLCLSLVEGFEEAAFALLDDLRTGKIFEATCKRWHEARSLSANAYCWALCGEIARELSQRKDKPISKEDIYLEAIRRVGPFQTVSVAAEALDSLARHWQATGTGWMCDVIGPGAKYGQLDVIMYYGSSSYDREEMGRLIDDLVADAQALGIDTRPPEEIDRLKSLWGKESEETQ